MALLEFHKKIGKVKKDAINPHFGKKYASLSNILDVVMPTLNELGIIVVQCPAGKNEMITRLIHVESGEEFVSTYEMTPQRNDPQGLGSAITYQRRYALGAMLSLNIDEDDDGNAASKVNGSSNTTAEVKTELPWLNPGTKAYSSAVTKLKAGTTTVAKIKSVMQMSKITETQLVRDWKSETVNN